MKQLERPETGTRMPPPPLLHYAPWDAAQQCMPPLLPLFCPHLLLVCLQVQQYVVTVIWSVGHLPVLPAMLCSCNCVLRHTTALTHIAYHTTAWRRLLFQLHIQAVSTNTHAMCTCTCMFALTLLVQHKPNMYHHSLMEMLYVRI